MDSFLGMPIEIGMDRFILGQALGLLTLAFNFAAYQATDQRTYFLRFTAGSAFWLAMFLTMGAQVPVILVAAFSTLRGCVFWWTLRINSPRSRMIARRTMYSTLAIAAVSSIVAIPAARPETQPLQVFLLVAVVMFVVGQYMPGVYLVRISAAVYAVAVLLLNTPLDTFNPVGIIIELNNLVAIAVFFVLLSRKKAERRRLASLRPAALALATAA